MRARRGVFHDLQDRPAPVGHHHVALARADAFDRHPAMLERHVFAEVIGVQRPAIDYLGAVGVDYLDAAAFFYEGGFGVAGGDGDSLAGS